MALTGNKGEWSEIYTLFKLLGDGKVHAGDANMNKLELYYPILNIIREESKRYEYKPNVEQHITLTYLYDAKYRVKGDGDELVRNVTDEPVSETLDAMHHYRDAIYYGKRGERRFSKEIIGGYILFPGRMDEQAMLDKIRQGEKGVPYFLQSIDEVNIGAYPLLPNEESGLLLEDHLRKVLLEETVVEQIEDSVPQRGLHYTRKDVTDKLVYVGYVKPENTEYELFKRNRSVPRWRNEKTLK